MKGLPYELGFVLLALAVAALAKGWHWVRPSRPGPAHAALSAADELDSYAVALASEPAPELARACPDDQELTHVNAGAPLASDSRVKVAYELEAEEDETTSPLARILISAKGDSDRGLKRRANEDSLLFMPERSLFAVADGMGGYRGGQVASTLAVETLRKAFER